jgi:heat-inducible transcriptional repressor
MLDARKAAILRKVVEEHIETAQPVGSAHVVRDPEIDVSPATVRSDMAALEREGYLTHPHTSAGRVPTDKGYRFFVDHFVDAKTLDPASEEQIASFFSRTHGAIEQMLRDTTRLLSELTDHAAVVVPPAHDTLTLHSLLLTRLSPRLGLLVAVLSNGVVEKRTIELDESLSEEDLEAANRALRAHACGQILGRLTPCPPTGNTAVDKVVAACHHDLVEARRSMPLEDVVYVGGTARMAEQFSAVDTVRQVLAILEQSFVVVSLLRDVLSQGQTVSIGAENKVASLAECSLVVAPYTVDNEIVGTIGVLGPTRMDYSQALATVAVVSRRLGRELAAGG